MEQETYISPALPEVMARHEAPGVLQLWLEYDEGKWRKLSNGRKEFDPPELFLEFAELEIDRVINTILLGVCPDLVIVE